MKNGIFIVFMLIGSVLTAQQVNTAVIKSSIACDHCLACGTCGERLDDAILGLDGVKNVEIDPKMNTITVYYKSEKIAIETIKKAIVAVGYDADEMKAEPAAYDELDGCCKKAE